MTRTPFQGEKVKGQGQQAALVVVLAGPRGHAVMVTYPYAYMTYIVSPLAGLGGAYRGGRPPTACVRRDCSPKLEAELSNTT